MFLTARVPGRLSLLWARLRAWYAEARPPFPSQRLILETIQRSKSVSQCVSGRCMLEPSSLANRVTTSEFPRLCLAGSAICYRFFAPTHLCHIHAQAHLRNCHVPPRLCNFHAPARLCNFHPQARSLRLLCDKETRGLERKGDVDDAQRRARMSESELEVPVSALSISHKSSQGRIGAHVFESCLKVKSKTVKRFSSCFEHF